jgi:PAS domain S-box-containing protein
VEDNEKVNILLVDDQPAKLLSYSAILGQLGENLIEANSGREALEHLLRTDIAVVLVDVCMPDLDGFELAAMIRQHPRCQRTAIIFVSGIHMTDLDRLKGYEAGAVDYVPVPVVPEILRARVGVFADLYRKTRQLERLNSELERRVAERTSALEASTLRLRESEERLTTILQNTTAVVSLWDASGRFEHVNRRFEELFGVRSDSIRGRSLQEVFPADVAEVFHQNHARVLGAGRPIEIEQTVPYRGELRVYASVMAPLFDMQGAPRGIVSVATDVTERKHFEDTLREADRRKDEFLAMLSHELRNPLAPIRNAVQVLSILGTSDPRFQEARDIIVRQVEHLTRLVDDLLDVSRLTRGKITLQKESLLLSDVVDAAVETSRPLIEHQEHSLSVRLTDATLRLEGDHARLVQVIANLLGNAAKFTPKGGHISLVVERTGGEAVIRVRDTGVGLAKAAQGRVFELFAQEETTLARSQGGLGIGLTLVKRLVDMHGGRVTVQSEGQGRGSEFKVTLPAMAPSEPVTDGAAKPLDAQTTSRLRVLVVEDNADAAGGLKMLLELAGHDVEVASDGLQALRLVDDFEPHVALVDLGLPVLDGFQVARRIRQEHPTRPLLIALSGYGREEDKQQSKAAGFDHHLVKPVDFRAILSHLMEVGGSMMPPSDDPGSDLVH